MTRAQIIANAKLGAQRAATKEVGATPIQKKHLNRLLDLKKQVVLDEQYTEEVFALRA